ncbi:MAG: PLD nuclease N-terminal domain-containing protein [Halioglobus sp.]|nr:PLD nuclease N-terminal domain-containing protein [Halioglobus sp.]
MEGIIGPLILIADIYAIVKIVQSSADTVKKVIWVLLVLILPVIGLIAWYFAGPGGQND